MLHTSSWETVDSRETHVCVRYLFIVNPAARNGRLGRLIPRMQSHCRSQGLPARFVCTKQRGDATQLALRLGPLADRVIAVGGDGTVHEVVQGLLRLEAPPALGVLACGTGNDFARALRVPSDWRDALRSLPHATVRRADRVQISWKGVSSTGVAWMANGLGVGFDALAAIHASRYKRWPGVVPYALGVFRALRDWKPVRATVVSESGPVLDGPMLMAAMGKTQTQGGGFRLTPRASPYDGFLHATVIRDVSILRILAMMPRALTGKHIGLKEVVPVVARELTVTLSRPVPLHADGEILSQDALQVHVSQDPLGLPLLQLFEPE